MTIEERIEIHACLDEHAEAFLSKRGCNLTRVVDPLYAGSRYFHIVFPAKCRVISSTISVVHASVFDIVFPSGEKVEAHQNVQTVLYLPPTRG